MSYLNQYIDCGFPVIPLGLGTKAPVFKGWTENTYPEAAFHHRNVGTRAGERVSVGGKEGYLLILDYDSPSIGALKQLCAELGLMRTTCVRTGGQHHGYHLYYLTESETRKHGMLWYRGASIDLLGKGSFAVVPPSVVDRRYRYLIGLEEIAYLTADSYDAMLHTLQQWKKINLIIKHVRSKKITMEKALSSFDSEDYSTDMVAYFREAVA